MVATLISFQVTYCTYHANPPGEAPNLILGIHANSNTLVGFNIDAHDSEPYFYQSLDQLLGSALNAIVSHKVSSDPKSEKAFRLY